MRALRSADASQRLAGWDYLPAREEDTMLRGDVLSTRRRRDSERGIASVLIRITASVSNLNPQVMMGFKFRAGYRAHIPHQAAIETWTAQIGSRECAGVTLHGSVFELSISPFSQSMSRNANVATDDVFGSTHQLYVEGSMDPTRLVDRDGAEIWISNPLMVGKRASSNQPV